jgi:precorrin-6Y C5,15-methyltransferase (decarboxylating)
MEKLYVIGFGPGGGEMLSGRAKEALGKVQKVLGAERFAGAGLKVQGLSFSALMKELENPSDPADGGTAVLVSGDTGFFSAAKMIIRDFSGIYDIEVIPGIGSISYFSAKIQVPYDDAVLISLHGRNENIIPKAAYNKKVFALTGGGNSIRNICQSLCHCGLEFVNVNIGEKLSYPDEKIVSGKPCDFTDTDFDELSVICIENPHAANPHSPLFDSDFIRGDIPMTKEEIRWLAVNKLAIEPKDIVLDIGAGTGSVSVEMARKAFDGFVYAIEIKEEACELVRKNAAKHGAFNIKIVCGEAPDALRGLFLSGTDMPDKTMPDKAFIGGSSGNMDAILEKLTELNPDINIVATAVTLQTLNQVTEGFKRFGIHDTDVICVNISRSKKAGGLDLMTAQNPVYIISGRGNGNE